MAKQLSTKIVGDELIATLPNSDKINLPVDLTFDEVLTLAPVAGMAEGMQELDVLKAMKDGTLIPFRVYEALRNVPAKFAFAIAREWLTVVMKVLNALGEEQAS